MFMELSVETKSIVESIYNIACICIIVNRWIEIANFDEISSKLHDSLGVVIARWSLTFVGAFKSIVLIAM